MAVLLDEFSASNQGRVKNDFDSVILARPKVLGDVGAVGDKHVFGLEDFVAVEDDCRESIKTFKYKI